MDLARTPVIVGVGQVTNRIQDVAKEARAPHELILDAVRQAAADAGVEDIPRAADRLVAVYCIGWVYPDLAQLVAEGLGIQPRELINTTVGGNTPQKIVNDASRAIARGELDLAILCGGEAVASRRKAHRAGIALPWTKYDAPPDRTQELMAGCSPYEVRHGLFMPAPAFAMFENALRARAGESFEEHQTKISELLAAFSRVAATHPNAWYRKTRSPEEIRTVSDTNRLIAFPYPKYMTAFPEVDMAAALVVCSAAKAQALGIPEERWVYQLGLADYHDTEWLTDRVNYYSSPAARAVGAQALAQAGIGVDDVKYVDLYSCFPCVPQIASRELGFAGRAWDTLTLTGGLPYFGGPWNNYSMHAIATLVDRLRADPTEYGFIYAIGMWLTKQSVGVYSGQSKGRGLAELDPTPYAERLAAAGSTPFTERPGGPAVVETYSIQHARDGRPETGFVFGRLEDGTRCLGLMQDAAMLEWMETHEGVGARGRAFVGDDGRGQFVLTEG